MISLHTSSAPFGSNRSWRVGVCDFSPQVGTHLLSPYSHLFFYSSTAFSQPLGFYPSADSLQPSSFHSSTMFSQASNFHVSAAREEHAAYSLPHSSLYQWRLILVRNAQAFGELCIWRYLLFTTCQLTSSWFWLSWDLRVQTLTHMIRVASIYSMVALIVSTFRSTCDNSSTSSTVECWLFWGCSWTCSLTGAEVLDTC